jgi:flagellar biosynthesis chaperone FliJ
MRERELEVKRAELVAAMQAERAIAKLKERELARWIEADRARDAALHEEIASVAEAHRRIRALSGEAA